MAGTGTVETAPDVTKVDNADRRLNRSAGKDVDLRTNEFFLDQPALVQTVVNETTILPLARAATGIDGAHVPLIEGQVVRRKVAINRETKTEIATRRSA